MFKSYCKIFNVCLTETHNMEGYTRQKQCLYASNLKATILVYSKLLNKIVSESNTLFNCWNCLHYKELEDRLIYYPISRRKFWIWWFCNIIELKEQRNELMHCTCINNVHTITGYCLLLMRIFQSKCNEDNAVLIKSKLAKHH